MSIYYVRLCCFFGIYSPWTCCLFNYFCVYYAFLLINLHYFFLFFHILQHFLFPRTLHLPGVGSNFTSGGTVIFEYLSPTTRRNVNTDLDLGSRCEVGRGLVARHQVDENCGDNWTREQLVTKLGNTVDLQQ